MATLKRKWIYFLIAIALFLVVTCSVLSFYLFNPICSIASIEKIDDHPLYIMHFYGDYYYLPEDHNELMGLYENVVDPSTGDKMIKCSIFSTTGEKDSRFFGRNYDWEDVPALILFTNPSDGYASVSMVDISWLGLGDLKSPESLSLYQRIAFLMTPIMPFDGMNEKGLCIAIAAVEREELPYDENKPTLNGLQIIRKILDNAETIDEAIDIFSKYNLNFYPGPHLHYLIADRYNNSAIVEFVDSEMKVIKNDKDYQVVTNFYITDTDESEILCDRYLTIDSELMDRGSYFNSEYALEILEKASWDWTQWSVVYDQTSGDIKLVMGRDYVDVHHFRLDMD
jgi:hypothetical protein